MDMKFSFISTSMIGFECMWTSVFMTLQIGIALSTLPLFFLMLLMLASIAASIFVTLSGPPEFCDTKAAISVCASFTILVPISWLASTLCAYNLLLLCPDVSSNIPCAHSARLLCGDIDAVYHTPARVSSVVVHLDLYHR